MLHATGKMSQSLPGEVHTDHLLPFRRPHADCASCVAEYAQGFSYSCRSCEGDDKVIPITVFCLSLATALGVVALVTGDLLRVLDPSRPLEELSLLPNSVCESVASRFSDSVPLTAFKIVVVVWQIVTQVRVRTAGEAPGLRLSAASLAIGDAFFQVSNCPNSLGGSPYPGVHEMELGDLAPVRRPRVRVPYRAEH